MCAIFSSFFFASTQATANFRTKITNKKKQNWTQAKIDDVLVFRYVSFITTDQFSLFFSHSIPPSLSLSLPLFLSLAAARSLHRRFATEYFAFYYLFLCLSFSSRMSASLCHFAFRLQFFHWNYFVLQIITTYTYFRRCGRSPDPLSRFGCDETLIPTPPPLFHDFRGVFALSSCRVQCALLFVFYAWEVEFVSIFFFRFSVTLFFHSLMIIPFGFVPF